MHPIYLQNIESLANVQFRIMEAKQEYALLADSIYELELDPREKQLLITKLTDSYYKILKNLFLEEILLNEKLF